jgi:hypothetical protein
MADDDKSTHVDYLPWSAPEQQTDREVLFRGLVFEDGRVEAIQPRANSQ